MLKLLLFFSILKIVHCNCPAGFQPVKEGQCRGLYGKYGNYYFNGDATNQAVSMCAKIGGMPVAIHDDEEMSYWSSQPVQFNFVIGLVCDATSKKWKWTDGSDMDFKPRSGNYDTALDDDCKSDCTWLLQASTCRMVCTGSANFDIFCTVQLEQPVASTDCGSFDDDSDDSVCYEIAVKAENWKDAQAICHSFGAEVTSVHSQQENSYIRRLAVSRGATNGVLIGGTISGKGNEFGWIDGSDWDYTNFHPGFPIDGFGECLSMDTITTSGQWMNTDCDAKLPIACSRPLHDTPEQNGCSDGPWKEGQIIYTPGFPNDASVPCEYFFSVAAGKKVKLQIMLLEANTCCDFLMITDGYIGGTIMANITGSKSDVTYTTSATNIMRVIWQPNGGVNVRGVMMMFSTY